MLLGPGVNAAMTAKVKNEAKFSITRVQAGSHTSPGTNMNKQEDAF